MAEVKKTNKTGIIAAIAVLAIAVIFGAIYFMFREKPVEGSKNITIEVVNKAGESTMYTLRTDAAFLREAMEQTEGLTFSGTEGEFGMMVDTVNGEIADYNVDGGYWGFYVNGDYCNYGIGEQPVEDGDAFSIVYTTSNAQ